MEADAKQKAAFKREQKKRLKLPVKKLVDITKLVKIATFAKQKKVTREYIYAELRRGTTKFKSEKIDGALFIYKN